MTQVQNGEERVIAYYSKTLSKPERNYCVTRRKLLAIVRALEHFHKYLYGREISLRTDHAALLWLLRFKFRKDSWQGGLNVCKSTSSRYNFGRGACMVMQMAYHEDRARKTADIAAERRTCLLYTSRCV